jgi:AcrR family transcriptional regulator
VNGYEGTSLRQIAAEAGVTAPLVTHHFGTKRALRDEVDAWILSSIEGKRPVDGLDGTDVDRAGPVDDGIDQALASSYLARVLLGGGEPASALLRTLVATTRVHLDEVRAAVGRAAPSDPEMTAALVVVMQLCSFAAADAFRSALGVDLHTDDGLARWRAAVVELLVGRPA